MAQNLMAIMPPDRSQTRFLFFDPEEKSRTINFRATSQVSKPTQRPPKISDSVEKRQRFNRSQTQATQVSSQTNSSEYHCTFSQFVQKAHLKEQQRLIKPKKKSSQHSVVSEKVQTKTANSSTFTNFQPNQAIDYSGFTINDTSENFFPTKSVLPRAPSPDADNSSLIVYKEPEAQSLNVSTTYPTQKEVLKMFMKIQGHRDQTETFLGDSKYVQKHRKRLVLLQQKRMATLARLKKSFQAKIPKVSLSTEEEVAGEASLLQVSIASAQHDRFISDGTLIWKNGYADEFVKKSLPKKVIQTPFQDHILRSKHQKAVSQSRAKSQLVEIKPDSPKKLVSGKLKGNMESLLEKINIANRERPEGVFPIETQEQILAFAVELCSVCETEVNGVSMTTPIKKVPFKSGFNTQQAFSNQQNSKRSSSRPVLKKQTIQDEEETLSVQGQKKFVRKQFSRVTAANKRRKSTESERQALKSPVKTDVSNKKVEDLRAPNEVIDKEASYQTFQGMTSLNVSDALNQSGLLLQTEQILEGMRTLVDDTILTYKKRKQHQHYHASHVLKPQEPAVTKPNDFESLLNVKPIIKPTTPFDYSAFVNFIKNGKTLSAASPKLPADESIQEFVQNQVSKLEISKEYLSAGIGNQALGKVNSEKYWSDFSRKICQSMLAQAALESLAQKFVPNDSNCQLEKHKKLESISQEALKHDPSVITENSGSHVFINPFSQLPEMREPKLSVSVKEADKKTHKRVSLLKLPQACKNEVIDAIHQDLQNQSPSFPALSKVIAVNPFPLKSKNKTVTAKDRSPTFFRAKVISGMHDGSVKPLQAETVSIDTRLKSNETQHVKPKHRKYWQEDSIPTIDTRFRTFGIKVKNPVKKDAVDIVQKIQDTETFSPVSLTENKFFIQNDTLRILTAELQQRPNLVFKTSYVQTKDYAKDNSQERNKLIENSQIFEARNVNYSSISTLPMRPFNKTPLTNTSRRTKIKFETDGFQATSAKKIEESSKNLSQLAIEIDLADLVTSQQGDISVANDSGPLYSYRQLVSEPKRKDSKKNVPTKKMETVVQSSLQIPAAYEQALLTVFSYPKVSGGLDSASFYGLSSRHNSKGAIKLSKKPIITTHKQPNVENLQGVGVKMTERPSRTNSKLATNSEKKPQFL